MTVQPSYWNLFLLSHTYNNDIFRWWHMSDPPLQYRPRSHIFRPSVTSFHLFLFHVFVLHFHVLHFCQHIPIFVLVGGHLMALILRLAACHCISLFLVLLLYYVPWQINSLSLSLSLLVVSTGIKSTKIDQEMPKTKCYDFGSQYYCTLYT